MLAPDRRGGRRRVDARLAAIGASLRKPLLAGVAAEAVRRVERVRGVPPINCGTRRRAAASFCSASRTAAIAMRKRGTELARWGTKPGVGGAVRGRNGSACARRPSCSGESNTGEGPSLGLLKRLAADHAGGLRAYRGRGPGESSSRMAHFGALRAPHSPAPPPPRESLCEPVLTLRRALTLSQARCCDQGDLFASPR